MPRAAPALSSFNSGELSPLVEGRVDTGKYQSGAKIVENYIPLVQGPAQRRTGTKFVSEVKDSTTQTWLVRFEFNTQQAYILEFGHYYIRFYTNHGQVQVSGVAGWSTAYGYNPGDLAVRGGINYYATTAHTSGTFATDLAAGYWYALNGTIYEIPSPYPASDLTASDGTFGLRYTESADIIYIAHQNHAPRKLERFGATNWQIVTLTPTNGPFKKVNTGTVSVYASAQTGAAVTVTANGAIFSAAMVGSPFYIEQTTVTNVGQWEPGKVIGSAGVRRRSNGCNYVSTNTNTTGGVKPIHTEGQVSDGDGGVYWMFEDPGYGYGIITGYTSPTQITMTVIKAIPYYAVSNTWPTAKWAFGAWSDVEGWPSQVTFFKERLTFGRGQNLWLSVAGDYENYASKDPGGNVTTDMAISLVLVSDKVNNLQWFASGDALVCGTAGAEFAVQQNTTNLPFGPDNVTAPVVSAFGSKSVSPVKIAEVFLFVQRSGLKLRDIVYDYLSNKYQSSDQNIFAEHVTAGGITQLVYQQDPHSLIWAVRGDGQLLCMTYSREQYDSPPYGGWHRHPIGGNGIVECLAQIPAPTGDHDELWMIVRRTINGVTRRYIEYLSPDFMPTDAQSSAFFVDSGATYSGSPATVISGLSYLEGQTVAILADGAVQPARAVSGGKITLDIAASVVNVGLPYTSKLQTMRMNAGGADGTSQGKTARINKLVVRFYRSLGLTYGRNFSSMDTIDFRTVADGMNAPPSLFTGDKILDYPGDYDTDPWMCFQQSDPLPSTIVGVFPTLSTYDRG